MTIGNRITAARLEAGLSQSDVMEATGLTRQSLSSWENDRVVPGPSSLVELSQLFGVSIDYLLMQTDVATIQR